MSLLRKLQDSTTINTTEDMKDYSGGGFLSESGIYEVEIKKAFLIEAASGAIGIHIQYAGETSHEENLYISTSELKTFYNKNGKDFALPSYIQAKKMNYLLTGEMVNSITDFKVEERLVKHYKLAEDPENEDKKKRVETEITAEVLVDWIGKKMKIAAQMCEKEEQKKIGDKYVGQGVVAADKDGKPYLEVNLFDFFSIDGHSASESINNKDAVAITKAQDRIERTPVRLWKPKGAKKATTSGSTSVSKPVAKPSVF